MFKPEIGKAYTLQEGTDDTTNTYGSHFFVPGSKVRVLENCNDRYYWCEGTSRTHGGHIEQIVHVSCLGVE